MATTDQPPTESASRRPAVRERSYPLAAIFLLAAVWAAMFGCVDGAALLQNIRDAVDRFFWPSVVLVLSVGLSALVGGATGFGQMRVWRSVGAGALIGAVCGVCIFAAYVAPATLERAAASAGVTLATAIALRYGVD